MKLMIATAFKCLDAYSPYVRSLAETIKVLTLAGIEVTFLPRESDSYVDRAKNWLLREFMGSDCQQILMIDSDMSWTVDGIVHLLQTRSDIDVVGGSYPTKNNWGNYCGVVMCDQDQRPKVDPETGLIRAIMVPGGFLKLTKRCVERMYRAYECLSYQQDEKTSVGLFQTGINGVYTGEDVTFCNRWKAIRGKLWIEPRLTLTHWGMNGFQGNFHNSLLANESDAA